MADDLDVKLLTAEERELMLDLTQMALDIAGIIEPTPVCDLSSAAISLYRKDWVGAALSVVGVIPFVGDLAKAGKIPNYTLKLERAITIAKTSKPFARVINPILARILFVLDRIPTEQMRRKMPNIFSRELMQKLRNTIEDMRNKIANSLPPGMRVMTRIDTLTDELLMKVLGSTKNVGAIPRRNMRVIAEFFDKHQVSYVNGAPDINAWANKIRGVDLHAVDGVYVDTVKANHGVAQYVQLSTTSSKHTRPIAELNLSAEQLKKLNGAQYYTTGDWMIEVRNGVSDRNLGISSAGRVRAKFVLRGEPEVLRSKAAGIGDSWTKKRKSNAGSILHRERHEFGKGTSVGTESKMINKEAELVNGGGEQIFLPASYKYLMPAPKK